MGFYKKDDYISVRINSVLRDKFHVAVGFLDLSRVLQQLIQNYVREYELQYGIIPVKPTNSELYHMINGLLGVRVKGDKFKNITKEVQIRVINEMLGISLTENEFDDFIKKYPKSSNGVGIFGDYKT